MDALERTHRARELSTRLGFRNSSSDDVGRLLRTLAATVRDGVIGELGTGCGVGTSWLVSGMRPDTRLVTFELDPGRAAAVRALFADEPRVTVVSGDSRDAARHGPFHLLFADGGLAKDRDAELLLALVRVGGLIVLDDLTAAEDWDEERRRTGDPVRDFWLRDRRLAASEIGVGRDKFGNGTRAVAIVATRVA